MGMPVVEIGPVRVFVPVLLSGVEIPKKAGSHTP